MVRRVKLPRSALALSLLLFLGCDDEAASTARECRFAEDCPTGELCFEGACKVGCRLDTECEADQVCAADGTCVGTRDASTDTGDGGGPTPGTCVPNNDGQLTRAEFPLGVGAGAPFRTLEGDRLPVEVRGLLQGGGLTFDFGLEGGTTRFEALLSPSSLPSSTHFPDATYAASLAGTPGLYAFFRLNDAGLDILGLADPSGAFTRLTYSPPLPVLRFPLTAGQSFAGESVATGHFLGASVSLTDKVRVTVRAQGQLEVPQGSLPAFQLLTVAERTFPSAGVVQRWSRVDFVSECGGFVAHAVSAGGETDLPQSVRQAGALLPAACTADADCGVGGRCSERGFCGADPEALGALSEAPSCLPDGDGVLAEDELPTTAGLAALYRVNAPEAPTVAPVVGTPSADGMVWDFSGDALGTVERVEQTLSLAGKWYADAFPGASYAALLDAGTSTLAVFERKAGGLWLRGLVSEAQGESLLVYQTPVQAVKLPLRVGDHWQANTVAQGTLDGQDLTLDVRYTFTAVEGGTIKLPAGEVPVIRLRIDSTQQVEGAPFAISRRTDLFMAECLGGVARVVSRVNATDESEPAAEISRLTIARCMSDLQCPAGATCEGGRCEGEDPTPPEDGGVEDGGALDGGTPDAEPDDGVEPDAEPQDGGAPLCNPEGDGIITRDEITMRSGLLANFRIAEAEAGVPVDLAGTPCASGRCWDFSGNLPGDQATVVELMPVDGQWFAEDFPDASYATLLDAEKGWLGVMRLSDEGLELMGTASIDAFEMKTAYDPPVTLYRFPLAVGDQWTVETTQRGYWGFSQIYTNDTYDVSVAARGQVRTPQGPFNALQVVTVIHQEIPFTIFGSDQVVHTFLSECFNIVARVVGPEDGTEPYFERAARVERLEAP